MTTLFKRNKTEIVFFVKLLMLGLLALIVNYVLG